ncbi:MFS transporter [Streptomyces sp.]|uniref:MFS transporter n=1 Tax=Streptomyces sp. TaxID=1931 RepID=UPI002F3E4B3F
MLRTLRRVAAGYLPRSRAGRILAAGTCVDALGSGLFFASSALYFVGVIGIPSSRVAFTITLAGGLALLAPVPMGRLADRRGPASFYIALLVLRGIGYGCYAAVASFPGYLVLTVVLTALDRSCAPIQQAVVVGVVGDADRTHSMASIRAVRNVGLTVGFLLSGAVFAAGTRWLFVALFLGNALSFLVVAWSVRRAVAAAAAAAPTGRPFAVHGPQRPAGGSGPAAAEVRKSGAPVRSPFRDRWFMLFAGANVVLSLYDTMLIVLLPVWILRDTSIDAAWVPVLMAVNTVLTTVLQVYVARFARGPSAAARLLVAAGLLMCGCCGAFALTQWCGGGVVALVWLVTAVVLLSLAENLNAVAVWELSTELSPAAARARYLGAFSLSQAGQKVAGPTLLVVALMPLGVLSWPLLAGAFASATALSRVAVRRSLAERAQPVPVPVTVPSLS